MKALLTFDRLELVNLREIARQRWPLEVRTRYDLKDPPGYWLVGDDGVYIMHNGKAAEADHQPVVYAKECNPVTNPQWWEVKRDTFGGDDGAEFVEAAIIDRIIDSGANVMIEFTDNHVAFYAEGAAQ